MFGHRYFGARYFGPRYFGPALAAEVPVPGEEPPDEEPVADPCAVTYLVDGSCPPNTQGGVQGPAGPQGPEGPPGSQCDWCCPIFCGEGSPEGVVDSPVGAPYEQTDAAITTHSLFVKRSGIGNTGWRGWAGLRGEAAGSFAIGDNAVASGIDSIAFGEDAEATGLRSIAVGKTQVAAGLEEINIGTNNVNGAAGAGVRDIMIGQDIVVAGLHDNSGVFIGDGIELSSDGIIGSPIIVGYHGFSADGECIVMGQAARANRADEPVVGLELAEEAIIIGPISEGNGNCILAVGHDSVVRSSRSTALGTHSRAGDDELTGNCTAVGSFAEAFADESTAIGADTTVPVAHANSIALGFGATTIAARQFMIGTGGSSSSLQTMSFNGSGTPAYTIDDNGSVKNTEIRHSTVEVAINTTLNNTHSVVRVDATAGNITINLPNTSGIGITGRQYTVKKIDASANTVTIDPNGAQTIDGAATHVLTAQFECVTFQFNGTNWDILT